MRVANLAADQVMLVGHLNPHHPMLHKVDVTVVQDWYKRWGRHSHHVGVGATSENGIKAACGKIVGVMNVRSVTLAQVRQQPHCAVCIPAPGA